MNMRQARVYVVISWCCSVALHHRENILSATPRQTLTVSSQTSTLMQRADLWCIIIYYPRTHITQVVVQ